MALCFICGKEIESDNVTKKNHHYHLTCFIDSVLNVEKFCEVVNIAKRMRLYKKEYSKQKLVVWQKAYRKEERDVDECLFYFRPCPKCGKQNYTDPCFDLESCVYCEYCTHPSITGDTCDFCGEKR